MSGHEFPNGVQIGSVVTTGDGEGRWVVTGVRADGRVDAVGLGQRGVPRQYEPALFDAGSVRRTSNLPLLDCDMPRSRS